MEREYTTNAKPKRKGEAEKKTKIKTRERKFVILFVFLLRVGGRGNLGRFIRINKQAKQEKRKGEGKMGDDQHARNFGRKTTKKTLPRMEFFLTQKRVAQ